MKKRCLEIVAALIRRDGTYLVAQRMADDAYGSLWEFPGGKIESGETPQQALRREMNEELGIDVEVGNRVVAYDDESDVLRINVTLYECSILHGEPVPLECSDVCWLTLDQIADKPLAPADKKAFIFLRDRFLNKKKEKH